MRISKKLTREGDPTEERVEKFIERTQALGFPVKR